MRKTIILIFLTVGTIILLIIAYFLIDKDQVTKKNSQFDKTNITKIPTAKVKNPQSFKKDITPLVERQITMNPTIEVPTLPPMSPEEEAELQKIADEDWNKKVEERYNKYPWLDKLPIETDDYFIYFDVEMEKFVVNVYNTEKNKEKVISQAIQAVKELGIDTTKYEFEWPEE